MTEHTPSHPVSDGLMKTTVHAAPGHSILVVDDTPSIHQDFRKILERHSKAALDEHEAAIFGSPSPGERALQFRVECASQGQEALKRVVQATAEGKRFSVAFVDIRMPPGWDGIETVEHLWKVDPEIQIVICTAYSDYSWDQMFRRVGSTDSLVLLKKPFDAVEVLQLAHSMARKWELTQQAKQHVEQLNELVRQRTEQLISANEKLLEDVTRRQRAEAALRKAQERLNHLITQSPVVIYSCDAKPGCPGPNWISDNVDQLLGFSPEEVLASGWWESHVQSDEWEAVLKSREELFVSGRVEAEYRLRPKSGDPVWIRDELRLVRDKHG